MQARYICKNYTEKIIYELIQMSDNSDASVEIWLYGLLHSKIQF